LTSLNTRNAEAHSVDEQIHCKRSESQSPSSTDHRHIVIFACYNSSTTTITIIIIGIVAIVIITYHSSPPPPSSRCIITCNHHHLRSHSSFLILTICCCHLQWPTSQHALCHGSTRTSVIYNLATLAIITIRPPSSFVVTMLPSSPLAVLTLIATIIHHHHRHQPFIHGCHRKHHHRS
jgi:hypothetical protein